MIQAKVLAIGNSFSQDATAYLHQIAAAGGVDMTIGNLYIGGCPLERHWNNARENVKAYTFFRFGDHSETFNEIAIKETLESEEWDYVTLQQASHDSGRTETYEPYLSQLSDYVKTYAPQAEQLIHQTWAYEIDSTNGGFVHYGNNQDTMFAALKNAYRQASETLGVRTIPCGEAVQLARLAAPFDYPHGGKSLCRDGFHARIPHGRLLLAAVWYEVLTGKSISNNPYLPVSETDPISDEEASILRQCAHKAVSLYR